MRSLEGFYRSRCTALPVPSGSWRKRLPYGALSVSLRGWQSLMICNPLDFIWKSSFIQRGLHILHIQPSVEIGWPELYVWISETVVFLLHQLGHNEIQPHHWHHHQHHHQHHHHHHHQSVEFVANHRPGVLLTKERLSLSSEDPATSTSTTYHRTRSSSQNKLHYNARKILQIKFYIIFSLFLLLQIQIHPTFSSFVTEMKKNVNWFELCAEC